MFTCMYSKTNFLKACELLKVWHSSVTSVAWLCLKSPKFATCSVFTQCPDSGVEPGRWVRSVLWGISLTRVYTVILLMKQTLQVGQDERAQVGNFSCYTWKSSIHCRGRPSFLFTHKKKAVSDPACGGRTLQIGRSTIGGSDPAIGAGDLCLHWGAKGGVWPRIWGSTPQSEHYVNAVPEWYLSHLKLFRLPVSFKF